MNTIFDARHAHFIGIGGISMSSIAHVLLEHGVKVTGSDQNDSKTIQSLKKAGATIMLCHDTHNISQPDIVIYTGAIQKDNPEYIAAQEKKIPLIPRTAALNDILQLHKQIIAISGTHGKTSVTSILTHILRKAVGDISYMIGAHLNETGKAYDIIKNDYITVEACEYQANFLNLYPTSLIINNIEPEHMDYYKSIEQLVDTFRTFAKHLPENGHLFINADDLNATQLLDMKKVNIITYGIDSDADYQAVNIRVNALGQYDFDLLIKGELATRIELKLFGKFNVLNALAAIATAHTHGINTNTIKHALASFINSDRRFEHLGSYHGATVVSDYAHHPSEVKATLSDVTRIDGKKIFVVFQPHTFSRTKAMLHEFSTAFHGVDELYISDIYAARESNIYNISSKDLVNAINQQNQRATYIGELKNIENFIKPKLSSDALLIMMGAGSIDTFARNMVE